MVESSRVECWGLESRAWSAGQGLFQAEFRVLGLESVFQGCANQRPLAEICSGKTRPARAWAESHRSADTRRVAQEHSELPCSSRKGFRDAGLERFG